MSGHELRKQRTRAAILASAARLFEDQGYAATTVAQIASGAGVSERAFFVHFPSKEDLLFGHAHDVAELACRVAEHAESPSPVVRTGLAVRAMIDATTSDDVLARQAQSRAALAGTGRLPKSLANHLVGLMHDLTETIAEGTHYPRHHVAPVVGAAVGAVQGAGYLAAQEGAAPAELRERMTVALGTALAGFAQVEARPCASWRC